MLAPCSAGCGGLRSALCMTSVRALVTYLGLRLL